MVVSLLEALKLGEKFLPPLIAHDFLTLLVKLKRSNHAGRHENFANIYTPLEKCDSKVPNFHSLSGPAAKHVDQGQTRQDRRRDEHTSRCKCVCVCVCVCVQLCVSRSPCVIVMPTDSLAYRKCTTR